MINVEDDNFVFVVIHGSGGKLERHVVEVAFGAALLRVGTVGWRWDKMKKIREREKEKISFLRKW
jgi:hypothetical protein